MCVNGISYSSSRSTFTTNEHFRMLKTRYTKLSEWTKVITLLYKRTLRKSMVDDKIDGKEADEKKGIQSFFE